LYWAKVLFAGGLTTFALFAAAHAQAEPSYVGELKTMAAKRGLAQSRTWQVLLHYHPWLLGSWRSSADGDNFFLAGKKGSHDPEAELEATLDAFSRPASQADPLDEPGQHPQCRFPARWAWLKQELGIDVKHLPEQPCPLFATWRQAISPEKVALIYSAAYINSPASMYGHTFLRLSRKTGEGNKLIDYIVNFAADADTSNGIVYALWGLFGGFKGHFYVMPYYVKIQEYSNIESRDLWEYELALTAAEAERLVEHTWETRSTHFNYYFATENCSYFLLELLESARPELHLSERFRGSVIPTETLRALLSIPGLIQDRTARPSLRAQILTRKSGMTRAEIKAAEILAKQGSDTQGAMADWPKDRQARTIDAAYDLMRFREGLKKDPSQAFLSRERQLLIMRGRTGMPPMAVEVHPASEAPETGHRSLRLGVSSGVVGSQTLFFEELSLRLALHDFLDPPRGYLDDAELEMFHLRLRFYNGTRKFFPERLDLLKILSVSGFDRWIPKTAWTVRASGAQAHNLGCSGIHCSYGGLETGGGLALRAGHPFLFYILTLADLAAGAPFDHPYRVGAGGLAGCVVRLGNLSEIKAEGRYVYYFLGDERRAPVISAGWGVNFGKRAELRLVGEAIGSYTEGRGEIHGYF
jgi:hypothetical protein